MSSVHELMTGLLDYIIEQAKAVDPRAFTLARATEFQRTPSALRLPGVTLNAQRSDDAVWLRVERLNAIRGPVAPELLAGLLTIAETPEAAEPSLQQVAVDARVKTHQAPMEERERIARAFDDHLRAWRLWSATEKPRRASMRLYADLFAMKHQIETEETAKPMELVWGIGVSSWQIPYGEEKAAFHYPLLTQAMEIGVDKLTMALEVQARDVAPKAEFEAVVACGISGASEIERSIRETVNRQPERLSPFDPGSYEALLKTAACTLHAEGRYVPGKDGAESCPPAGPELVITDDWVLFARPRSNSFLLDDIRRLREKVSPDIELPEGPKSLVSAPTNEVVEHLALNFRGLSSHGGGGRAGPARELFFPLPYNDEQVAIVEKLEQSSGVAVQGPPGTGKTHTIANVICHYLATGRRVLVTSRGEPALEVLQDKIPAEVRPLTVALLSGDRSGTRQFQSSIEAIQHRVSQLNPHTARAHIDQLESNIDALHGEIEAIDARVGAIAQAHLDDLVVDGVKQKAHKAADLVVHGKSLHGWFDDALTLAPEQAPPLGEEDAERIRSARRRLGDDLVYLHARLPQVEALPSIEEAKRLHELLMALAQADDAAQAAPAYALKLATPEVLVAAEALVAQLDAAGELLRDIERDAAPWGMKLRQRCREASYATERAALESVFKELDGLVAARAAFLRRPVLLPAEAFSHPKVLEAVQRASQAGKPFGLLSMPSADLKAMVAGIKVAGLPPADADAWQHVSDYLALHGKVLSFETRWNAFAADMGIPRISGGVEQLRSSERIGIAARKAHRMATTFDKALPKHAAAVFASPPYEVLEGGPEALGAVQAALRVHLMKSELARAAVGRSAIDEHLAGTSGPIAERLRGLVSNQIGQRSVTVAQMSGDYAGLLAELKRVHSLLPDLRTVADAVERIRAAGGVRWAHKLSSSPCPTAGDDTAFPVTWRAAWNWARLQGHLDSIEARVELRSLAFHRDELTKGLERAYVDLVAQSAWLNTKNGTGGKAMEALVAYATAVKNIGKGFGKSAAQNRRDAREAMVNAASAVPCWIMSHARVSESMPAVLGAFDLVIVDEASQSDLWALPAILRGKKILVVGDDKQVSPNPGFISTDSIAALRTRFLRDQPYASAMSPTSSLYDLAARVFASYQVMLREHFRCVEPIISYSNRFYGGSIQPLRVPRASERLDPPLVDIYLPTGRCSRRNINEMEARVICEEIQAILADPKMAGRTLGVVSLLGMEQAKHIDETVRTACDAAELLNRRFECGDARTFQGSERDLMFLSLVADSNNHHALSGNSAEQRFNVAASRARDRMVLVRSVELSELSTADLRRSLLEHFQMPVTSIEAPSDLIALCESGFEREVFGRLMAAGYRTRPQVKVGAYRIDMVVEGADDRRLAIELDGNDFHGPDRWRSDVGRQRILERAGWTFWRCFASTWTLNKEAVFSELCDTLRSYGIEPLGPLSSMPLLVEHRMWLNRPGFHGGCLV